MKTKIFLVILSSLSVACEQQGERDKSCVHVVLKKELCGQAILEILDPAYFDQGQRWTSGDGVEYKNVFSTILPCNVSDNLGTGIGALDPGLEFYIQFNDSPDPTDGECIRCKALLVGPEKFYYISVAGVVCDGNK